MEEEELIVTVACPCKDIGQPCKCPELFQEWVAIGSAFLVLQQPYVQFCLFFLSLLSVYYCEQMQNRCREYFIVTQMSNMLQTWQSFPGETSRQETTNQRTYINRLFNSPFPLYLHVIKLEGVKSRGQKTETGKEYQAKMQEINTIEQCSRIRGAITRVGRMGLCPLAL